MILNVWTILHSMYIMRVNKAVLRPFTAVFRKPYIIHSQRVYAILIFLCGNFIHRIVQCKSWRWNIHGGAPNKSVIMTSYDSYIYLSLRSMKHSCLDCPQDLYIIFLSTFPRLHFLGVIEQAGNEKRKDRKDISVLMTSYYKYDRLVIFFGLLPCFYTLYSF